MISLLNGMEKHPMEIRSRWSTFESSTICKFLASPAGALHPFLAKRCRKHLVVPLALVGGCSVKRGTPGHYHLWRVQMKWDAATCSRIGGATLQFSLVLKLLFVAHV